MGRACVARGRRLLVYDAIRFLSAGISAESAVAADVEQSATEGVLEDVGTPKPVTGNMSALTMTLDGKSNPVKVDPGRFDAMPLSDDVDWSDDFIDDLGDDDDDFLAEMEATPALKESQPITTPVATTHDKPPLPVSSTPVKLESSNGEPQSRVETFIKMSPGKPLAPVDPPPVQHEQLTRAESPVPQKGAPSQPQAPAVQSDESSTPQDESSLVGDLDLAKLAATVAVSDLMKRSVAEPTTASLQTPAETHSHRSVAEQRFNPPLETAHVVGSRENIKLIGKFEPQVIERIPLNEAVVVKVCRPTEDTYVKILTHEGYPYVGLQFIPV